LFSFRYQSDIEIFSILLTSLIVTYYADSHSKFIFYAESTLWKCRRRWWRCNRFVLYTELRFIDRRRCCCHHYFSAIKKVLCRNFLSSYLWGKDSWGVNSYVDLKFYGIASDLFVWEKHEYTMNTTQHFCHFFFFIVHIFHSM